MSKSQGPKVPERPEAPDPKLLAKTIRELAEEFYGKSLGEILGSMPRGSSALRKFLVDTQIASVAMVGLVVTIVLGLLQNCHNDKVLALQKSQAAEARMSQYLGLYINGYPDYFKRRAVLDFVLGPIDSRKLKTDKKDALIVWAEGESKRTQAEVDTWMGKRQQLIFLEEKLQEKIDQIMRDIDAQKTKLSIPKWKNNEEAKAGLIILQSNIVNKEADMSKQRDEIRRLEEKIKARLGHSRLEEEAALSTKNPSPSPPTE